MTTAAEHFQRADEAFDKQDWAAAGAALEAGLDQDPDAAPLYFYRLGLVRERQADWEGTVEAVRQAIARRSNPPAWWHFKLARALRRLRRWSEAAESFEAAVEIRDDVPPGWYFQLGSSYEHLSRWDAALDRYRTGLALDPDALPVEAEMLARETNEFPARRTMVHFIADHLDEIKDRAAESLAGEDRTEVIYTYWAQGFESAPEIVRRCHQRLLQRSTATVLDLDEPAMRELIKLPDDIEERDIHPTHRSDLLRLELLARHGGSWLDATCLVTADPAPELAALRAPSGYFAFGKRRTTIASWLMTAVPDHYLVRMLRAGLHTYWQHHDKLTEYFVLHHIFEALSVLDEEFGRLWAATPQRSFADPFRLRWKFGEPCTQDELQRLLAGSFVHKLTYKYEPWQAAPGTTLGELLTIM